MAGTILPSGAILWAHAENIATNEQAYLVEPPTVSRALTNPLVGGPFAIVMIVGAVLLMMAITQIIREFMDFLKAYPEANTTTNRIMVALVTLFEIPAILGMVILSQYTGNENARMHDTGSYMLFFGHSFAIITGGLLIHKLKRIRSMQDDPRMVAISQLPAHALWVAIWSAVFGVAYFGGKKMPVEYTFSSHLAVAVVEVIALLGFLTFLARFWRFLLASEELKRAGRKV